MNRRTALLVIGGAFPIPGFAAGDRELIDRVADMIIPPDQHSPGAQAAGVGASIALVIANSPAAAQKQWSERLRAFEQLAVSRYNRPFLQLGEKEQAALLDTPQSREFLAQMKKLTLAGYYTSKIGLIQELGYQGNQVMGSFPGCPAK